MHEGDEDRQAGIDDDEDEGSDLDLGDKPEDTGQILFGVCECRTCLQLLTEE